MRARRRRTCAVRAAFAAALALGLAGAAGEAGAQIRVADRERDVVLEIGGTVQPRYEFLARRGEEDLSSFFLRRVRLDVRGHAFTERFTFRILPELARTASMRDAYVDYRFRPELRVRFGQYNVPFQWHRYVSAARLHFSDRDVPGEEFGFPNGRDVGVMLHGENATRTLGYGVGVFDGAGRNVERSNSAGTMVSGRVTAALAGQLPRAEPDIARSREPGLSLGLGFQTANRSEVRRWDLGRSATGLERADWLAGTADASFRWLGFSTAAALYGRRVRPADPAVADYDGGGYLLSTGYTLLRERLDVVGRYSSLRLDRDDADTRATQWGLGFNVYLRAHASQARVQYLLDRHGPGFRSGSSRDGLFLIEYQVLF